MELTITLDGDWAEMPNWMQILNLEPYRAGAWPDGDWYAVGRGLDAKGTALTQVAAKAAAEAAIRHHAEKQES